MKTTWHFMALICFFVLIIPFSVHADDTAVYEVGSNVKPNVLIIFDNSISMGEGVPYDDSETYTGSYATDTIYKRSCIRWNWRHTYCYEYSWTVYSMTLAEFEAGDADDNGIYDSNSGIRKGNRLNFENSTVGNKLNVAKEATKQIIDGTYDFVRLGIMLLHGDVGWDTLPGYHKDNTVLDPTNGGSEIKEWDDDGGATDKDILKGYVDQQTASGATPLAVRLINAAQYFKHEDSTTYGNFGAAGGFADPTTEATWCRQNYVIIVTDGLPTYEGDTTSYDDDEAGEFDYIEGFLPYRGDTIKWNYDYDSVTNPSDVDPGDYSSIAPGGGSDYLDDVAKYLYDTDLRPEIEGKQNIKTFTIGFTVDHDLLSDTAYHGHGTYETADTPAALEQALRNAMATIIDRTQTFTAPVVPVQRTTSGDKMYISLFTPRASDDPPYFWPGYLIKLKIGSNGELTGFSDDYGVNGGTAETQVTDSNGILDEELLNPDRPPYAYWDAQQVLKGTDDASRQIYTYLNISKDLNHSSNGFTTTNTSNLTDQKLGYPSDSTALIKYIRGLDSYDEDGDTVVNERRNKILGDILHSRPLIIDYEASNSTNPQRVIYVGTNDGMLHAFNDTDGSEKWAFIPPDLLPTLKNQIEGTGHQYYVDSSPQAYILDGNHDGDLLDVGDQVIIVFGERRGGNCYCALDVSDPDDPQFLWRIDNSTDLQDNFAIPPADLVLPELGQTWSEPLIGTVKQGATDKDVVIIGGGYWPDEQSKGNAIYLIDITSGSLVKSFNSSDHANMTYSIPSTVLGADTTFDGYINRVYVGDLGGQMWRIGNQDPASQEDGDITNWTPRRLFASNLSPTPKIFYPPDIIMERGYAYLYFGTGDRSDPMSTTETNRFFAVKDKDESDTEFQNRVGVLTESHLVDLTEDLIQEDPSQASTILAQLAAGDGWYIDLENTGEKVLAPATVIFGMVLFTTFTPVDVVAYPCSFGGDARLYALNYLTGESVKDWDADNNLDKSDRSLHIGQGIPTEVVITITDTGHVRGYVGAGGGIGNWDLTDNAQTFSINSWREIFLP